MASRWFSAVEQGHVATLIRLTKRGAAVDARDRYGKTALMVAAWRRQMEGVRVLLAHGADPNVECRRRWTAMTYAVMYLPARFQGHPEWPKGPSRTLWELLRAAGGTLRLREAVILGDVELARAACEAGESPDGPARGLVETYLVFAADYGHREMVRFLLDRGADIEGEYDLGERALKRAAEAGHEDIVELLLDRGADPNHSDWSGVTPRAAAVMRGHQRIAERLLVRGARRSLLDAVALDDVALVEHLLREGAHPDEIHYAEFGRLPMYAVRRGNSAIARLLMDRGASHLEGWCDSHTLLAEAPRRGLFDVVRVLVECGADLQQVGKDGRTALEWAIREGREEVTAHLRQSGAVH